jgi:enolase
MGKYQIQSIHARQILDSRGNPTVEVDITTGSVMGRAQVPSGASTGQYEALELRDKGKEYGGKAVMTAVNNVNEQIQKKLLGVNVQKQKLIDKTMLALDGTENKSHLGANALLGVSLASARAASLAKKQPLYAYLQGLTKREHLSIPIPFSNVINGGKHAAGNLKFQEFMIAPIHADSFSEGVRMVAECYQALQKKLHAKYGAGAIHVGDEGGFAPPLNSPFDALELLQKTIEELGYSEKVKLAMDPASSEFFQDGKYEVEPGKHITGGELVDYYATLMRTYPIVSIEDGFEQNDFASWKEFTKRFGSTIQIVGDDLLVTNTKRIQLAAKQSACNALLLKVNQIGTLSEAISAAQKAFSLGWNVMVSHRSGETEDTFISDLTVALDSGQIKLGAPCRGERTAKYNQLLRIEEELKAQGQAHYKRWK